MDPNLMSCPTCGHAVSGTAASCAYCGAIISGGSDKEQTDAPPAAQATQATVPEPPVPSAELPPVVEIPDDTEDTQAAAGIPAESVLAKQMPAEPIADDSAEPAIEAEPLAEASANEAETAFEVLPAEEAPAATPEPETVRLSADSGSHAETATTEAVEPAPVSLSEPATAGDFMPETEAPAAANNRSEGSAAPTADRQTQAESEPEIRPVSPAPEVLDLAAEEPVESETLGADIIEMVETLASDDQGQPSKVPAGRTAPDETAGGLQVDQPEDRQPLETQESAVEKRDGLISEELEETILLEPADEVQPAAAEAFDQGQEKTKLEQPKPTGAAKAGSGVSASEPQGRFDMLKIENAAQEMAAAIKKQKATLSEPENSKDKKAEIAKIQALKKKKLALAKEQAKKKQKLLLAKAAALKRKKAAESIKKQREVPAGGEAPKEEKAAAAVSRPEAPPAARDRSPQANSKMQDLLKKYEGRTIGINYDNSAEIREALLEEANREYFSVYVKDKQLHYNYPLKTILTVIEGQEGVEAGNSKQPHKYNAVIKVYPLVLF